MSLQIGCSARSSNRWGTAPAVRQPAHTDAREALRNALHTIPPTDPISVALSAACSKVDSSVKSAGYNRHEIKLRAVKSKP